ncbi:MAG: hypothetical protein GTO22_25845, partial [Gemmatimonadales bacterium]|nr:hypothetical protein [Gemmatimonadales bacterium]
TAEGLVAQDLGGGYPNLLLSSVDWPPGFNLKTFQWLPNGSGVAFTFPIDSTSFGIYAVPRMGGDVTPLHVETVTSGQPMAGFRVLSDSAYLIVRILEPVTVAPWLLVRGSGSERGIDVPRDIMRLWDAAVSPDGAWIAYIGERGDRTTVLATISLDGARHNVIVEGRQELAKWDEISVNPLWPANRTLRWPSEETLYFRKLTAQGLDVYTVRIEPASGAALGEPSLLLPRRSLGANFDVSRDR